MFHTLYLPAAEEGNVQSGPCLWEDRELQPNITCPIKDFALTMGDLLAKTICPECDVRFLPVDAYFPVGKLASFNIESVRRKRG